MKIKVDQVRHPSPFQSTPHDAPAGSEPGAVGANPVAKSDWKGTSRYEVRRCLGQGGMGVVYEALDRDSGQLVAVKTLIHSTPAALYLFKQEFRTLADVSHPNLVRLHELVMTDPDHVFFAMELVRGTDFLTHVLRPGFAQISSRPLPPRSVDETQVCLAEAAAPAATTQDPSEIQARTPQVGQRPSPAELERLRPALRQLVEGVAALHAAHKLHRDIKPSNVLVTQEGRIVLLDFGVATEFSEVVDDEMHEEHEVAGTARYMAPEQAFDKAAPACDWYSVGVMLYEALVGHAPFIGPTVDVLTMKNSIDPLPPSVCVSGVPSDLDALCVALLHREPAMRPDGKEILRRLGAAEASSARLPAAASTTGEFGRHVRFAGRELQFQALRDAFHDTLSGRNVTVRVSGRSGMGKSTLVNRFLDELVEQGSAVVLRGRAYEREAVPYKAFDSVIDSFSRYLMCLSDEDLSVVLPRDAWALACLFPVLRRVPAIGALRQQPISEPHRMRRRAFLALRALFSSLARRRPIVLFVDDAQWGDTDSALLWLELVRPPQPPPLLLAMTYRDEDARTSPFLSELRAHWPEQADMRDLAVGPLAHEDARRLALRLLGPGLLTRSVADAIARESAGNPFLVEELAYSVSAGGGSMGSATLGLASVTLDQMVGERLASLPHEARRMLEIVALSGRPVASSIAARAAGMDAWDETISLLRTRRFLRVGLRNGQEALEAVHARIGETIVGLLPPVTVREHHARLVGALETMADVDVEALATHLLGAGETTRAAQFAERAAELAAAKFAFDEAARLLRLAIATHPASSVEGSRLRKRLGEVLEWAGKSAEAGLVYLEAAEGAPTGQKFELQRAAAEQLYASGRAGEATRVLQQVLAAVGIRTPRTGWFALFWLFAYRLWLRVRGLRFREREASEVSAEDRLRIDALYSATLGLSLVDYMRCIAMRTYLLIESLRVGDRLQIARAAAAVANDLAADGPETNTERALWDIARRLAEKENTPAAKMAVRVMMGAGLWLRGRWSDAREAVVPIASMVTNRRFALQSAVMYTLYSLYFIGEIAELTQRYNRLVADADESGNAFMSANLRAIAAAPVWLAADDPERARRELGEVAKWKERGFAMQWRMCIFGTDVDLYVGDGAGAYERVKGLSRAARKNFYVFIHYVRAMTAYAHGRAGIASMDGMPARLHRNRLAEVRRLQRRLERERMAWTDCLATILRAGWACASGQREAAAAALRSAIDRAEATQMPLHAAAARYQLGVLLGGEVGEPHVREAVHALAERGVRAPARFAAMLVPGPWTPN
jgi:serine/threonine protein kinase